MKHLLPIGELKRFTKISFVFVLALLMVTVTLAQSTVGGRVTDDSGQGLPGVTVLEKGTTNGAITNVDGSYTLSVPSDAVLIFTYIGFETQEVPVGGRSTIDVDLAEDLEELDEVVVIGYGTQKKSHLTGAISKVENKKLDQIPLARADDALIGQVSGVNIQATGGDGNDQGVGSDPQIRIRGTGSITGGAGPLLVIDGTVVDADFFGSIDMNDVESFEILKDAASAAIFGSRGANGVIMITTKQGQEGPTRFSYNAFVGIQDAIKNPDWDFSAAESFAREAAFNGELSERSQYKQLLIQARGEETVWQDEIFDGGGIQSHSLSARGGNQKTKFSTSLTYLHDEGVMITDDFKKYNLKAKVDTEVNDRVSFGISVNPSFVERRRFDGSTHDILRQTPWLPVLLDETTLPFVNRLRDGAVYADAEIGDYALQRMFDDYDLVAGEPIASGGTDISNTSNTNPAAKVLERDRRDFKFKVFGRAYAKFEITDDLQLTTALSGNIQDTQQKRWQGVLAHRNGAANTQSDYNNINSSRVVTEAYLTYDKSFGDHEIIATVGFTSERLKERRSSITGTGFEFDYIETINGASLISAGSSFEREKRLESYFGRVNYAFADKYLASISVRRDGSSVFGPNNKFGTFPAASIGWRVSEESFLQGNNILNNLKLRVSYGITGNDDIRTGNLLTDWYAYSAIYTANTAVGDLNSVTTSFNANNIANPDLGWERSVEFNPAVDFGLFGNVISGSIDYYKRTSDDLLLNNPVSTTTGFGNALVNIGEVTNEGVEVELRTNNLRTQNLMWSTTFIASRNKNTLTDFADADGQITNVDSKRAAEWINQVGNPISSFYGYVVDKDIPLEYLNDAFHPIGGEAQDVYVKDLNGDGVIDADDKTILGSPYPDLVWSVTNEVTFKNFDVSFMFQGSHGAEVRNMGDQYLFNHFNSSQDYDPAITPDQEFIREKIFTSDIIQDASYISLRNVNIGYSVPTAILGSTPIKRARIYLSGQNLMYLKAADYTGFNPEAIERTSAINHGYQRGGSPIARKYVIGVNLDF